MAYFQFSGSSANRTIFFSSSSFVSIFLRVTIWYVDSNWLVLAKGDNTALTLAFLKLYKALSLNLRDLNNVSSECLKCKLDPAVVNMLSSGLK